jgi:hypothetical protein
MKPVEFDGSNALLGKDQPEYQPLPALRLDDPEGTVISCWELEEGDLAVLSEAPHLLWLSQLTFNRGFSPQLPSVFKPLAAARQTAPPTQQQAPSAPTPTGAPEEIVDLYSVDCQVNVRYLHTEGLLLDIMEPALRLMLAKSGGIPPVGSVVTLMMSVERPAGSTSNKQLIIMPEGASA